MDEFFEWIFNCGGFCFSLQTGLTLSAVVTLKSIKIYKTHEWLKGIPTVYFTCKGENKTILPDVKKAHELYSFKGEESWQVPFSIFGLDSVFRLTTCVLPFFPFHRFTQFY